MAIRRWHPFFRSYGANLQSSLKRFLSRALVHLHPPTCGGLRYGRQAYWSMCMSFSRQKLPMLASPRGLSLFHYVMYTFFISAHSYTSCLPVRIINLISIDYALRPHLRTRLTPSRRTWLWETLGLRRTGFSPVLSLLMSASSLVYAPLSLTVQLQRIDDALLPRILHECNTHPRLRYWI